MARDLMTSRALRMLTAAGLPPLVLSVSSVATNLLSPTYWFGYPGTPQIAQAV